MLPGTSFGTERVETLLLIDTGSSACRSSTVSYQVQRSSLEGRGRIARILLVIDVDGWTEQSI